MTTRHTAVRHLCSKHIMDVRYFLTESLILRTRATLKKFWKDTQALKHYANFYTRNYSDKDYYQIIFLLSSCGKHKIVHTSKSICWESQNRGFPKPYLVLSSILFGSFLQALNQSLNCLWIKLIVWNNWKQTNDTCLTSLFTNTVPVLHEGYILCESNRKELICMYMYYISML